MTTLSKTTRVPARQRGDEWASGAVAGKATRRRFRGRPAALFAAGLAVIALLAGCQAATVKEPETRPAVQNEQGAAKPAAPAARLSGPVGPEAEQGQAADAPKAKPMVERGTGVFLAPAAKDQVREVAGGDITLNFVGAETAEVVRSVLGDILHLNYAIDPAIKGAMTLQTSQPLARQSVLAALEGALRLNGIAIVKDAAQFHHVVPREKASTLGAPVSVSDNRSMPGPGFSIRIVPLRYISAAEMENVLTPLAPKGSILLADKARNLLMLAAPQQELAELEKTIELFDVDWLNGMSFAITPLEFADPETVVKELEAIIASDTSGPLADILRFVPVKRLNSVLVISSQPKYMDRAQDLVAKLDRGGDGNTSQIFVYYVQNGSASELAATLGGIFGISETSAAKGQQRNSVAPMLAAERMDIARPAPKANTVTSSDPQAPASAAANGTQSPAGTGAAARKDQAPTVFGAMPKPEGEANSIRIMAAPAQNAILIWATPSDHRMIRNVLTKLDMLPLQVFIQATIAEVTLNDELSYGVQWFFQQNKSAIGLTTGKSSTVVPTFPGFSYVFAGVDVQAVVQALESVTDVKVISAPTLMVLDNQTATLQVGDQVPVLKQEIQQTANPQAPIVNSIELQDTGVILQITPHVNVSGLIMMDIDQQASRVAKTTTSGIDSPTIQQRRITTTVAVQSGDSVALGGLIQDSDEQTASGVPGLRSIPVLGNLFGSKSRTKKRTELLMLLTPKSVASREEAQAVTDELRKRLKTVVPLGGRIE